MKEKLAKLIGNCRWWGTIEDMTVYLLSNGVEVRDQGELILTGEEVCGDYRFICSICEMDYWEGLGFRDRTHYCPNCGSRLRRS